MLDRTSTSAKIVGVGVEERRVNLESPMNHGGMVANSLRRVDMNNYPMACLPKGAGILARSSDLQ